MRVTLVFPPNRNIPATAYGGLPLLSGCLQAAGHPTRLYDANLEAFERVIRRDMLQEMRTWFEHTWNELRHKAVMTPDEMVRLQGMAQLAIVPFDRLLDAERAVEILRDRESFLQPDKANWAYDTIANVLRAVYASNPQFYQLKPGYLDELFGYLAGEIDNPIHRVVKDELVDEILATKPDLIGISIPFNEQSVEAFAIAKVLKQRAPNLKIVVGGSIISAHHELMCNDPRFYRYFDFAMPGEADMSLPALATALDNQTPLDQVPNLYWRDEQGTIHKPLTRNLPNLNETATPDYRDLHIDRYFLPVPVINYQTSRGCYYGKCTFCSFDIKQNFRFRKAELVIEDIKQIQQQIGVRHIMFWDPLTPPRLMRDVAKWNRERPEDERFWWAAETKFEKLFCDPVFTQLIADGGARFLQFGYESGDQEMLDLMVKGNDLSRVHLMLGALQDANIAVSVQWFIGFPGATPEKDIKSYTYLDEHREAVLLSSYMGTYAISPDDDIFRSKGDMYQIDLFQHEDGRWDYEHRDGRKHYDLTELDRAFQARGDRDSVTRMGFFIYLTENPKDVRKITGFERGGDFPRSFAEMSDRAPFSPEFNFLRTFDFDVHTPPAEQGVPAAGGPLPQKPSHALLVTQVQVVFEISDDEKKLIELADGKRSAAEIAAAMGGDRSVWEQRLLLFVQRGILVLPHKQRVRQATPTAASA